MGIVHEILFSGLDLELEVHDAKSAISIVTFEARNKNIYATKPSPFESGFGKGKFAPMGFNEFIIKKSRNHWYQTTEMLAVAEIVNRLAKNTQVITYGGSMGGFAAINFAPMLNAEKFVALSPLHDIQDGNEANDDRWAREGKALKFPYNFIKAGACRRAQGFAFYCSEGLDLVHAKLLERDTAATLVPVRYGGHPCSFFINDTYKLKPLIEEIALDKFSVADFHRKIDRKSVV